MQIKPASNHIILMLLGESLIFSALIPLAIKEITADEYRNKYVKNHGSSKNLINKDKVRSQDHNKPLK